MTIPFTKKWFQQQAARVSQSYLFPNQGTINQANVVWINDNLGKYIEEGYSMNDVVYSISQITSEKIKVAPWNVYQVKDESSLKRYHAEMSKKDFDFKKALDYRTKALALYDGDSRLNELLKWPNENESFSDLVAHSSVSKMMTGNRYIQAILLDAGANTGKPIELYLLPPQFVNLEVIKEVYPLKVAAYQLNCGTIIPFSKEQILHDKYYNPNYDQIGSHLYGLAPLKAARHTLTNDNSATEASTKSFQNMGPGGVLYLDDQRMTGDQSVEQASAVKKKYNEEWTGPSATKKVIVSGYKIGFTEMGLSPVDLAIIEQQKWNLTRFCNVWNFPHLMLTADNATDNNVGWAERALTSRCALPLMTSFRDNFNRKLQTDWGYKGKNIYIDYDQSVYSELDVNRKEATDWIQKSWHLSIRQRYELQNIEIPDEVLTKYADKLDNIYAPANMVELNDLGLGDIETDLSNEGLNDYDK